MLFQDLCQCLTHPTDVSGVLLSSSFLCLGIKDADKQELKTIASEPTAEHVVYVDDFHLLHSVAPKLSRRLCFTASEPPQPIKQTVQGNLGFSLYPIFHLLKPATSKPLDVPAMPWRWTSHIPSGPITREFYGLDVPRGAASSLEHLLLRGSGPVYFACVCIAVVYLVIWDPDALAAYLGIGAAVLPLWIFMMGLPW